VALKCHSICAAFQKAFGGTLGATYIDLRTTPLNGQGGSGEELVHTVSHFGDLFDALGDFLEDYTVFSGGAGAEGVVVRKGIVACVAVEVEVAGIVADGILLLEAADRRTEVALVASFQ
jgi:hypothetical protein